MEKNFAMNRIFFSFLIIFCSTCFSLYTLSQNLASDTIVEKEEQISDFEARFELAKILNRHSKTREEALHQFSILRKESPNNRQLLFEIGKIEIAEGHFENAIDLFSRLLGESYSQKVIRKSTPSTKDEIEPKLNATIVPANEQVSDNEARLELAKLYSHHTNTLDQAIEQYQILLEQSPTNVNLIVEISSLYIQKKEFQKALCLLYPALHLHPDNRQLLTEASRGELALGHAKKSLNLVLKALALGDAHTDLLLDYANVLMLIGDFYQAEGVYKKILEKETNSLDFRLNLAWVYVSSQRYQEAEQIYRKLLFCFPNDRKIIEALVVLKIIEKEFDTAICLAKDLHEQDPKETSLLYLLAEAYYKNSNYEEAIDVYQKIIDSSKDSTRALIGQGKAYKKMGNSAQANANFNQAIVQEPTSKEAIFQLVDQDVTNTEFIYTIIDKAEKPEDLIEWGNIYSENGISGMEIFFRGALNLDTEYYPAKIGLAQALSANYNYQEALDIYLEVLEDFPEVQKIMIEIARIQSWGKNYKISMEWYNAIIALNPENPVPRIEMARVAYWGKFFNKSICIFDQLLTPSVDEIVLEKLRQIDNEDFCGDSHLNSIINVLVEAVSRGSLYEGYEQLAEETKNLCFEDGLKRVLESLLIDYFSLYKIQKAVKLERDAKYYDWNGYIFTCFADL